MNGPFVTATPWEESVGACACCGRTSKTIRGHLSDHSGTRAVYFVQWTLACAKHDANVDLLIGPWGEGAKPEGRVLVSVLFRPSAEGGSFMVTDGTGRPADSRDLCSRALQRVEVAGTPLSDEVFGLLDALWLTDPRIGELKALNRMA